MTHEAYSNPDKRQHFTNHNKIINNYQLITMDPFRTLLMRPLFVQPPITSSSPVGSAAVAHIVQADGSSPT